MPVATDRDLLMLEPGLFREVLFASQVLYEGEGGEVTGEVLTCPAANFISAGILPGMVVLLDSVPREIVEVLSDTQLRLSILRAGENDEPIPPGDATDIKVTIATFLPQVGIVHRQLLRTLGIEPAGSESAVNEEAILNPHALRLAECYGSMEMILAAAASLVVESSTLWTKARAYRQRYATERQGISVKLDTDGDGKAETVRRVNTVQLLRG